MGIENPDNIVSVWFLFLDSVPVDACAVADEEAGDGRNQKLPTSATVLRFHDGVAPHPEVGDAENVQPRDRLPVRDEVVGEVQRD